jgi:cyclopropane-fatty-acyl-phospholipid synthase
MMVLLLKQLVRTGSLKLIDGRGRVWAFGDGAPPRATIRLQAPWTIALNPSLRLGEAYMDGSLTLEAGTLVDLLAIMARNFANTRRHPLFRALLATERFMRPYNSLTSARRNVAHHYDLSSRLYDLFLDADRQYSCAYFTTGEETLEEAQAGKQAHIASKLALDRPHLKVLDIGCGWGGLAFHLARVAGAEVTGITLSREQLAMARSRCGRERAEGSVRFELCDYRQIDGVFDRIVSVGMFEHVGRRHYAVFFRRLFELLSDDGVALLHTVGFSDDPAPINPFIRKYIFPGAELPSLSEIAAVVARSGLVISDVEILRQH